MPPRKASPKVAKKTVKKVSAPKVAPKASTKAAPKVAPKAAPKVGFFKQVLSSIYGPEFYANRAKASFWKAFAYISLLVFLNILLVFILLGVKIAIHRDDIQGALNSANEFFPAELEMTFEENELSVNVPEPYFFGEWKTENGGTVSEFQEKTFVVIDTKNEYGRDLMDEYSVWLWFAKDELIIDSGEKREHIEYTDIPNFVLDRSLVADFTAELAPKLMKMLIFIAGPMLFLIFCLVMGLMLLRNILHALVIFLVTRINSWNFNYASSYKVGLYGMTLPIFLDTLMLGVLIFGGTTIAIPFIFLILSVSLPILSLSKSNEFNKSAKE